MLLGNYCPAKTADFAKVSYFRLQFRLGVKGFGPKGSLFHRSTPLLWRADCNSDHGRCFYESTLTYFERSDYGRSA
jgi:hypothetical protein